jgi:succinate dehydrogenase/fumarate reductase flavoprotein subunit
VHAIGGAGLVARSSSTSHYNANEVVKGVQDEFLPLDKNIFRTEAGLLSSLGKLDELWNEVQKAPEQDTPQHLVRSREAVALVAAARWAYFAGLERKETRGMHKRLDYPLLDPTQRHYLAVGGLDTLWTRPVPVAEEIVPEPISESHDAPTELRVPALSSLDQRANGISAPAREERAVAV